MKTERKAVYKAGEQSASDPFEFIMSTDSVDRHGDVVEQDWVLSHFKKNPIALWGHSSSFPIGTWKNVRVVEGKLMGKLVLAEKGTSEHIDMLRSLVDQRVLRAVSVGFYPGEYEALDEEHPWNGYKLSKNELMECSLVSVGANREALSTSKSAEGAGKLFNMFETEHCGEPAAKQLGVSRDSDKPQPQPKTHKPGESNVLLSDKIKAKQAQSNELKNQLSALTDEIAEGDDLGDDVSVQMDELNAKIVKCDNDLDVLLKAEKSLTVRASTQVATQQQKGGLGSQLITSPGTYAISKPNRPAGHKAMATMACLVKSHMDKMAPMDVAKHYYKDEPEMEILVRAATAPATMTDADWAQPLVRDTWGEFMDLIRDISVYPRLPGAQYDFDSYGRITLPKNIGRGKLNGSFVGEGAPIPVREGAYGSTELTPKKMAVISTFTREIGMHSMPAIQSLIQNQMLEDTAETLDALYLDANARTTVRPAGMQDVTETGAGNINAASGATVADIIADTIAMVGRMIEARTGNGAVWIMNPLLILSLRNKQDAASGEFVFRSEIASGTFQGYPVITSQNVPTGTVWLQSNGGVAFGNDYAPTIEVSDQATIVFDDTAPDQVLPDTNTMPTRSMFQTDSIAVKMRAGLDWRVVRIGGVQVLTGVAW